MFSCSNEHIEGLNIVETEKDPGIKFVRSTGGYTPPVPIPETLSAFHPRAQRTVSRRRDARPQQRSFALDNPRLRRSPNSIQPG